MRKHALLATFLLEVLLETTRAFSGVVGPCAEPEELRPRTTQLICQAFRLGPSSARPPDREGPGKRPATGPDTDLRAEVHPAPRSTEAEDSRWRRALGEVP